MVRLELDLVDLANTRFAISPLGETVHSLRALSDPSHHALHLPWLRDVRRQLAEEDRALLLSLVGLPRIPTGFRAHASMALPDFLTPRPHRFVASFEEELAVVRATAPRVVRRDLVATHAPDAVPPPLGAVTGSDSRAIRRLQSRICATLQRYWEGALAPVWEELRLVLEADMTYRARQLATGGAQQLFADIHPNVRWSDGTLAITEMVSDHTVQAGGRGLLLVPSIFAVKPAPPLDPGEPPSLTYPSRGIGTLWAPPPEPVPGAIVDLLGSTRALLLQMLEEPFSTIELARRLGVTPSAVSQHLQVLHATGLVTRARDHRHVLYRRSLIGEQLTRA